LSETCSYRRWRPWKRSDDRRLADTVAKTSATCAAAAVVGCCCCCWQRQTEGLKEGEAAELGCTRQSLFLSFPSNPSRFRLRTRSKVTPNTTCKVGTYLRRSPCGSEAKWRWGWRWMWNGCYSVTTSAGPAAAGAGCLYVSSRKRGFAEVCPRRAGRASAQGS
jgi:hypothetical protein